MTKIKNMAYWKAKNNNSPLEQSGYSGGTGLDSDLKRKSNIDPETGQHGSPAEYASPTKDTEAQIAAADKKFGKEGIEVKASDHQTSRDRVAKQVYHNITDFGAGHISQASQSVRSKAYKEADKHLEKVRSKKA